MRSGFAVKVFIDSWCRVGVAEEGDLTRNFDSVRHGGPRRERPDSVAHDVAIGDGT
jgi:hypothetical protein